MILTPRPLSLFRTKGGLDQLQSSSDTADFPFHFPPGNECPEQDICKFTVHEPPTLATAINSAIIKSIQCLLLNSTTAEGLSGPGT